MTIHTATATAGTTTGFLLDHPRIAKGALPPERLMHSAAINDTVTHHNKVRDMLPVIYRISPMVAAPKLIPTTEQWQAAADSVYCHRDVVERVVAAHEPNADYDVDDIIQDIVCVRATNPEPVKTTTRGITDRSVGALARWLIKTAHRKHNQELSLWRDASLHATN